MRTRLWLCLLAVGCGPSLNPELGGEWQGSTVVTIQGMQPRASPGRVVVTVTGDDVRVANLCPDGSGSVVFSGAGDSAEWTGSLECPPVTFSDCQHVVFAYTAGTVALNEDGSLRASATGVGIGCGTARPMSLSFTGERQ